MSSTPYSVTGGNYQNVGTPQQIGVSASSKVSFYGATPIVQAATIAAVTTATITSVTTTAATSTTPYGYAASTQADAIVTAVNALITRAGVLTTQGNLFRTDLIALGLIAAT